jgi:hypothetical protein
MKAGGVSMVEKEIDEAVVKYINGVSGQIIEFSDEIHFTENGEKFYNVTFDGALGIAFRNIAYLIGFVLEKREEAERTAELKIRNLGLQNIPKLTIYEELELIELQEKIKLRTTPIKKFEPRIELFF